MSEKDVVLQIVKVLKEKFPNLSVIETVELANKILDAIGYK